MTTYTAIAIIYNPNSTGNSGRKARLLKDALVKSMPQVPVDLRATEYAGHAADLAYEIAKSSKTPLLVSSSGDGGYHEVINGAMRAKQEGAAPICAVLAAGNANDHARTLQTRPLSELIPLGAVRHIDLLQIEVHAPKMSLQAYAHSYIGLGLTPNIAIELNKHKLNSLLEGWSVFKTFWKFRPVQISINGETCEYDSFICSNISEMAKILTLAANSKADDGLFEIITFPHARKLTLLRRLLQGTISHLSAERQTSTVELTILSATPLQLDGEVHMLPKNARITIRCAQHALRTIA